MDDEQYVAFLMFVASQITTLRQAKADEPQKSRLNTFTIEDEGFSRWMGWRGEDAQCSEFPPAQELKEQRQARHMREFKRLRDENDELKRFLGWVSGEIDRRLRTF